MYLPVLTDNQTRQETNEKTRKIPGEDAANRVQEALSRAAGEVLMRSKLPALEKARIASDITGLGEKFAELSAAAWKAGE